MLQLSSVCLFCSMLSPYLSCSAPSLCLHLSLHLSLCFLFLLILFLSAARSAVIFLLVSRVASFIPVFLFLPYSFHSICLSLSRSISRCRGPLCEHDSADQRPPPLLLLGGRQETFLHRQRQHGLEITGHSIQDPPPTTACRQTHIQSFYTHTPILTDVHTHPHLRKCNCIVIQIMLIYTFCWHFVCNRFI